MEKNSPRLDKDGNVVEDVLVNPKAIDRKARESAERDRIEAEQKEPWSREKIEREILRASRDGSVVVVNGEERTNRANFQGHDFSGLDLSGLDLSGVNLDGAKLVGTKLTKARLVEANLRGAELTGAEVDEVNAVGANMSNACLCAAKVGKSHFMEANLSDSCCEATEGFDIVQKSLTPAEAQAARYKQAEGFRVEIQYDDKENGNARVLYVGATLEKANITGIKSVCQRRKK